MPAASAPLIPVQSALCAAPSRQIPADGPKGAGDRPRPRVPPETQAAVSRYNRSTPPELHANAQPILRLRPCKRGWERI